MKRQLFFACVLTVAAAACAPTVRQRDGAAALESVRGELERLYKENADAFMRFDTAFAIVSQHLDRMALRPDNQVHHVETWVTQRETWIRSGTGWRMWCVDQLRNQRRLIDGRPG